jgi:hypothetical protein
MGFPKQQPERGVEPCSSPNIPVLKSKKIEDTYHIIIILYIYLLHLKAIT